MGQRLLASALPWRARRYHSRPILPATLFDAVMGAGEILRWSRRCCEPRILHLRGYVPGFMALLGGGSRGTRVVFDPRSFMVDERIQSGMWAAGSALARIA